MSARWPVSPAAVALDALEPGQEALATRLLAHDAEFRAEVERAHGAAALLAGLEPEAWSAEPPPPLRLGAVTTTAGEPPEQEPAPAPRRAARRRLFVPGAIAAALAVVALAVVVLTHGGDDGVPAPPPTMLALRPLPGASGRAQLRLNGAGTEAELRVAGLRPSGAHHYYEAWLADDRGRMVSMGTFAVGPSGRADVHMEVVVDVSRYALVDVSLEPDDGDPQHSDDSVLRGRL